MIIAISAHTDALRIYFSMMQMTKKFDIFEAIYVPDKKVYFMAEKIVKLFL